MNIKKILVGTAALALMLGTLAVPVFAAGNSTPGIDRYLANPGRQ